MAGTLVWSSMPLVLWLWLLFPAAPAAENLGTLRGTVYGGSGIVIPNARISVTSLQSGRTIYTLAEYSGKYTVRDLRQGRYRLAVPSIPAFSPVEIEVQGGSEAVADLRIGEVAIPAEIAKRRPVPMSDLDRTRIDGVAAFEVTDYNYGNYLGGFEGPSHADGNPRRAVIILWKEHPFRFVFWHEASYCPFLELPSGAAASFQFFEGNAGWAELFNNFGRKERNSFVEILDPGPKRVWVRWTYHGVNLTSGEAGYRGTEDFFAFPNGLILRRQSYQTLRPGDDRGYAREPVELIGMCPAGKLWFDVLKGHPATGESHALIALDPFSQNRYDVFWKRKPGGIWEANPRRTGSPWIEMNNARGIVLAMPMLDGMPFTAFGDASGFRYDYTRIKEHSHTDTGGVGWVSQSWDHWPVGWVNSQGHPVDENSLAQYPNHFSPAGMDFFALSNEESERGVYYSLIGVGRDTKQMRRVVRQWLELGQAGIADPEGTSGLTP